jgi:hypothetical protein
MLKKHLLIFNSFTQLSVMYFMAVALTAATFVVERKQGLFDRILVAGIIKVTYDSNFRSVSIRKNLSRRPDFRDSVSSLDKPVYYFTESNGFCLCLCAACFQHHLRWKHPVGFGSWS